MKKLILPLLLAVLLSSCKTLSMQPDVDLGNLPPERQLPAPENEDMIPSDLELSGQPMTIIWNMQSDVRDDLKLTLDLREKFLDQLKRNGIQIKDPKDRKTNFLINEIERSQQDSSALNTTGEDKVHYYVKGNLTRSVLKSEYSDPVWCPFCDDKRPGSCEYELDANLQIDILALPSLRRIKHLSANQNHSFSVDASKRCLRYNAKPETANQYQQDRNDIVEDLVECSFRSLKKFLSPEAYIQNYYSDGKRHLYKISAGSAAGFEAGDGVKIMRVDESGISPLGGGTVASVQTASAMIEVSSQQLANQIRLYDKVKIERGDFGISLGCIGVVNEQ